MYEGLGDAFFSIKKHDESIDAYKKGLDIANQHLIKPKVVDLNSKIAQAYNASGKVGKAETFFDNSLDLAEKETRTRGLEEKVTVADFQNTNQNYTEEIQLRKEIVEDVMDVERDSILENESAIDASKAKL